MRGRTLIALVFPIAVWLSACTAPNPPALPTIPATTGTPTPAASPIAPLPSPTAAPAMVTPVPAPTAAPIITATVDLSDAYQVVREYFYALGSNRSADAWALLAPDAQARLSEASLAAAAQSVRGIYISALQTEGASSGRVVYRATLYATPNPDNPGEWTAGQNTRWVELVRIPQGWRIAQVSAAVIPSGVPTPVADWLRLPIPGAGITLDVPRGWSRLGSEWAWSPAAASGMRVGVTWSDVGEGWQPTAMLPDRARVLKSSPVDLVWAKATIYTVEVAPAGAQAGAIQAVETHAIVRAGGKRAYDFYASGRTSDDLETIMPVLQRVLTSVKLAPGQ